MGIRLHDGSRIGVVGGGPAGSLFAYFLLTFARRMDLNLCLDIYEPRDFTQTGPDGCNMCGGIVSESLVQALAGEGIGLPPSVVQRGIDSYVLCTAGNRVRIDTPSKEKRIAAVHRGGGPRDLREVKWGGLDGYLLTLARELGAVVVPARVSDVGWENGRPQVHLQNTSYTYDLLVGASGVNSAGWQLYEKLGLRSRRPDTTRAYITELPMGEESITRHFGSSMHVFLLDIPRLDFAAIIPKGDFLTVCLLGQDVDRELISAFFNSPVVKNCFPAAGNQIQGICRCAPRINVREATVPYMDRVVLVGDCGVTRLYKDGIGAAYRTAKAAAITAVFSGVSAEDFQRKFWPACRAIEQDNTIGKIIFVATRQVQKRRYARRAVLRMVTKEQQKEGKKRRMSM